MNIKTVCAMGALLALCSVANAGPVLDAVKARGQVICGVNTAAPGFASADKSEMHIGAAVCSATRRR